MTDTPDDPFARSAALQKSLQQALQPLVDLEKKLQDAMQPFADVLKKTEQIRLPVIRTQGLEQVLQRIIEDQKRFGERIEKVFGPLDEVARKLAEADQNTKVLAAAGLLPHYSTPFDLVAESAGDIDAPKTRLSNYYQNQWAEVRQDIESRLARYDVDGEVKATFREALDAHEARCYRSVCHSNLPISRSHPMQT